MPEWVKEGIPGEKFLGKDHEGAEYTAHDVWKKKMIWKPQWKKQWKTVEKQAFKTEHVTKWKTRKVSHLKEFFFLGPKLIKFIHLQ